MSDPANKVARRYWHEPYGYVAVDGGKKLSGPLTRRQALDDVKDRGHELAWFIGASRALGKHPSLLARSRCAIDDAVDELGELFTASLFLSKQRWELNPGGRCDA